MIKVNIKIKKYRLFFIIPLICLFWIYNQHSANSENNIGIHFQPQANIKKPRVPYIQFCGAAQMVGGSCYLIDTGKMRLIIDFGLFYEIEHQAKNTEIPFDPTTISYVILSHAHIDHSGRIPLLYKRGFKGKVIATDATKSISGVMLEMSLKISQDQGSMIYDHEDLIKTMNGFITLPYDQVANISDDVSIRLRDAGHIMGSAIIELWIKTEGRYIKIVATGDMGSDNIPLLKNPFVITEGDYILLESTYGTIQRKQHSFDEFGRDIQNTINSGGSVLIPAFVLEKTQKILYVIGELKRKGIIKKEVPVLVDSSTGQEITKIYRKYKKYYDVNSLQILNKYGDPLSFPYLYEVKSKASLAYHDTNRPAIYLTSSGMLDFANAPKHLEKMVDNPKNLLAIVGWQSPESLGKKLQNGIRIVQIPIVEYKDGQKKVRYAEKFVKMKIKTYGQFSSHTDGCYSLQWLSNIPMTKKVFVIHGEKASAQNLAEAIKARLGFDAVAPSLGEIVFLNADDKYCHSKQNNKDICFGMDESDKLVTRADQ